MRQLTLRERKQRGCAYCLDMAIITDDKDKQHMMCAHGECPNKVLDKFESYEEYMESEDSKILVTQFMEQAANCYTLAQPQNHHQRWRFDKTWHL